jgi:hypothetical protein
VGRRPASPSLGGLKIGIRIFLKKSSNFIQKSQLCAEN